jgi:hypothetical protein
LLTEKLPGGTVKPVQLLAAVVTLFIGFTIAPAGQAHHSFAMYDQNELRTFTGRLTRYIPGANHAQLIFEVLDDTGEVIVDDHGNPVLWGVETGPATRIARQGVTPDNFPIGTIITVQLNPLRNGKTFGAMPNGAPLVNCGMSMPEGGCTEATGTVYLSANN